MIYEEFRNASIISRRRLFKFHYLSNLQFPHAFITLLCQLRRPLFLFIWSGMLICISQMFVLFVIDCSLDMRDHLFKREPHECMGFMQPHPMVVCEYKLYSGHNKWKRCILGDPEQP